MEKQIQKYIVQQLEKKAPIPNDISIEDYHYLDNGHIDSLGLMKFIVLLEQEFEIEFTEDELMQTEFRSVSGLTKMILHKKQEQPRQMPGNLTAC